MDRLFLDANVLFSAAYRDNAGILKFWNLRNITLVTSQYAIEEAKRNFDQVTQITRLTKLTSTIEIHSEYDIAILPNKLKLRDKDKPILAGAIASNASHLITGDVRDFGCYFGKSIGGVLIVPPSEYLSKK